MERLLILSSNTGEGHNSAARAIAEAAAGWTTSIRKPLEESSAVNRSLAGAYNFLLTHRPGWMGPFTQAIDRLKPNEADFYYTRMRRYIQRFVESEAPDLLLSVHPMLNHMVQRWVREHAPGVPCYTFVTDPFPPFWRGWISPHVDRYFVLTAAAAAALETGGVPAGRIERVAMPLRPGFRPRDADEVREIRSRLGIEGETILVNGGARGGGPVFPIVDAILRDAPNANVLAVCGANARLRARLDGLCHPRLRAYGFVEDIHALVGAADLVITKPGALSTYETLASGVPAALSAVGGLMPQESGLFEAARREGFAFAVRTLHELAGVARQGLDEWRRKQVAIGRFYRHDAGPDLVERINFSYG